MSRYALAVDIGGTFTDVVLRSASGQTVVDKTLTTPESLDIETDERTLHAADENTMSPHDAYVSGIERGEVRKAIEQLPAEAREVILLREYEELSYGEIAGVLDCPVGTVMSRLARARMKLKQLLCPVGHDRYPRVAGTRATK